MNVAKRALAKGARVIPKKLTPGLPLATLTQQMYLHAIVELLEEKGSFTMRTLSRKLKVSRQAVWKMFQTPGFAVWVHDQLKAGNAHYGSLVVRKLLATALRTGSLGAAELGLKAIGVLDDAKPTTGPITVNIANIAGPGRPEDWPGGFLPDGNTKP